MNSTNTFFKKLTGIEPKVTWIAVRHFNHYIKVFSVFVLHCKWILIHEWVISTNSCNWTKLIHFEKLGYLCKILFKCTVMTVDTHTKNETLHFLLSFSRLSQFCGDKLKIGRRDRKKSSLSRVGSRETLHYMLHDISASNTPHHRIHFKTDKMLRPPGAVKTQAVAVRNM